MVTVTVIPPSWDRSVILGCQECCKNFQIAKLKFRHMLLKSKSQQEQMCFHASPFQLIFAVILTLSLPDICLSILNKNAMYYIFRVPYSTEEG